VAHNTTCPQQTDHQTLQHSSSSSSSSSDAKGRGSSSKGVRAEVWCVHTVCNGRYRSTVR
jgi:hypothetical protein